MPGATYAARVIVLRKTKLGESDLILTLLAKDGSQLRAVAKGARKPSSSFSARLELYAVADALFSEGRGLDIVKEARLVAGHERLRCSMEHAAAAAPMAELLDRATHQGLENPRLFDLTAASFAALDAAPASQAPALAAAHLVKALAFIGLRPSLSACVGCGAPVRPSVGGMVPFSVAEGGAACPSCRARLQAAMLPAATLGWCEALLRSTLSEVAAMDMDAGAAFSVLRLVQQWVREHVGAPLKSLEFLFTCGLF